MPFLCEENTACGLRLNIQGQLDTLTGKKLIEDKRQVISPAEQQQRNGLNEGPAWCEETELTTASLMTPHWAVVFSSREMVTILVTFRTPWGLAPSSNPTSSAPRLCFCWNLPAEEYLWTVATFRVWIYEQSKQIIFKFVLVLAAAGIYCSRFSSWQRRQKEKQLRDEDAPLRTKDESMCCFLTLIVVTGVAGAYPCHFSPCFNDSHNYRADEKVKTATTKSQTVSGVKTNWKQ